MTGPTAATFDRGSRIGAIAAGVVAGAALVGWILDIPALRGMLLGFSSMKPNTALCLLLSAAALWSITHRSIPQWVPLGFAAVVVVIAGLTVIEYATGANLGIDQMLFIDDSQSTWPGRMAPMTATALVGAGISLMCLLRRRVRAAHVLAVGVFVIGLVAIVGYIFGVGRLHTVSNYASIALPTSLAFCGLSVGILSTHPTRGLTGAFASEGSAGVLVRRVLPLAITLPIFVGWLLVQGEDAGWYAHRFGTSITVAVTVLLLGLLIWWSAGQLAAVDAQRVAAQQDLRQLNLELEERIAARTHDLSESEERFRAVSESATDAVISSDDKGRISYTNSAAAELFGYTTDELVGAPVTVLMPERFRDAHREGIRRFLATGTPKLVGRGVVELVGLHRNGVEIPIELSLSSWTAHGQTYVTGIIRDVTERAAAQQALEEREQFFRALAENVSDLIIRMDAAGAVTYASPAITPLLGYTPEEVIGRTVMDFVPPEGASEIQRVYGRVFNGESASTQQPISRRDGTSVWMEGIASPTSDPETGVTTGIIWIIRDITKHLDDLEREREIAHREQELNQLKNEFVGIVAHDLKSPMTVIGGFADILIQQWDDLGDREKVEFLGRIRDNVARLSTLVDDVLQVSRIESGDVSYNIAPLDLAGLARRSVEEISMTHPDRDLAIRVEPDVAPVLADEDRVWRVLTNLVSNALKFSDPEAPVEVCVSRHGDEVNVLVQDRGHGIEPADMDKLFMRFSRIAQPRGKAVQGTGLGLYISRQLIEAQGGRIWAESTPGQGSAFHFTLPVAEEQA